MKESLAVSEAGEERSGWTVASLNTKPREWEFTQTVIREPRKASGKGSSRI